MTPESNLHRRLSPPSPDRIQPIVAVFEIRELGCLAAVALTLWHVRFSMCTAIRGERTANVYLFLEFALTIPTNETF